MAQSPSKIEPMLAARLGREPDALHPVVVSFRQPQTEQQAAALGLAGEGLGATGMLKAEAIRRLAEQESVTQIALIPDQKPFHR
jgi:hypothetical protein